MNNYMGFGVAGNFADHLEQAGEANEFKNVKTDEKDAPKGIFPFYIPESNTFLGRYCIDNEVILMPKDINLNVQGEAEVGIECEIEYSNEKVAKITPKYFMALNDVSVRNDKNAKKLSQKKNFSNASKGIGNKIPIDKFEKGGICDNFSIISFLSFENKLEQYGENAPVNSYSYFYNKLISWSINKLNEQEDISILEHLHSFIKDARYPKNVLIAVGATKYTHLGETRFLKENDEIYIVVYNHNKFTSQDIKNMINNKTICSCNSYDLSFVHQVVKIAN